MGFLLGAVHVYYLELCFWPPAEHLYFIARLTNELLQATCTPTSRISAHGRLKFMGQKMGGLHGEAICTYNVYTHGP